MATRAEQIKAREDAIKRRLDKGNSESKKKATASMLSDVRKLKAKKKSGTVTKTYNTQKILGEDKGFTKSDYGVGSGAAIPYQVGAGKGKLSTKVTKPKPKPKPKPKGHHKYKVKRGDTLSGIAKKYGTNWRTVWNYNLKKRKPSTVRTLKKRGPHLIYRGGTFYIPKK